MANIVMTRRQSLVEGRGRSSPMTNEQAIAIVLKAARDIKWAQANWERVGVAMQVIDALVATTPTYKRNVNDER